MHKLLNIENESAIIKTLNEWTKFRATSVKSYYENDIDLNSIQSLLMFNESSQSFVKLTRTFIESQSVAFQSIMSQSDDVSIDQESAKSDRDQSWKYSALIFYLSFVFNNDSIDSNLILVFAFVAKFETINYTSFSQFAAFRQKKTIEFIEKKVFQFINRIDVFSSTRMFNSRFVDKIKYFDIDKTFEKFRFVVQTFNDQNKNFVLI